MENNSEVEMKYVTLEDGQDYDIIADEIICNVRYLYLANINDREDVLIRKVSTNNGKDYIIPLEDKEEVNTALIFFTNKYINKGM